MAVIDSLEIDIQSKSESVNKSLDDLVRKLGLIAEGIDAIGKNSGLADFAKKAKEATQGLSGISSAAKNFSTGIEPQIQKVSKSFDEIAAKYKDLGKGFVFKGSTAAIQNQIDKYSNALENAKLKKQELELAGKTEGQGYEDAVKNVLKYTNMIGNLKSQLMSLSDAQALQKMPEVRFYGFEEENINVYTERLKEFDNKLQEAIKNSGQKKTTGVLEDSLAELKKDLPEAKDLIASYEAEIQRVNELNTAMNFPTFNIEQWKEQFKGIEEVATKTSDDIRLKIENLQKMFENSGKDFVFKGNSEQLDKEIQKVTAELDGLYKRQDKAIELGKIDTSAFKELIRDIENARNRFEILENSRPEALNRTLEENAQKARQLREQLVQLKIPTVDENNLAKLQSKLDKTKQKMISLKTELQNKLTMGKITATVDDSGYRNLREQIALTGKTIDALQGKIKSLSTTTGTPKINADIGGLEETIQNLYIK